MLKVSKKIVCMTLLSMGLASLVVHVSADGLVSVDDAVSETLYGGACTHISAPTSCWDIWEGCVLTSCSAPHPDPNGSRNVTGSKWCGVQECHGVFLTKAYDINP